MYKQKQNNMKKTTFKVTYTKRVGGNGSILVLAENEQQAISNAKGLCATGSNFRDATELTKNILNLENKVLQVSIKHSNKIKSKATLQP